MGEEKQRLDTLLVEAGYFTSRERAQSTIMAGKVYIDGIKKTKCGEKVKVASSIEVRGEEMPFVSRGGYKLDKAIKAFGIELKDKKCMDIGASTGGFTDCMLQNGAIKVFSIDVGYGQFAWKLRVDERVVCMERTNVRYVTSEQIGELCNFASIDVSFISLTKVIPPVLNLLDDCGEIVALIKPQFEAGRDKVGKKGVVKNIETHIEVITNIINFLHQNNLNIIDLDFSPIKGPEGNIEYLVYFSKDKNKNSNFTDAKIQEIVDKSYLHLKD